MLTEPTPEASSCFTNVKKGTTEIRYAVHKIISLPGELVKNMKGALGSFLLGVRTDIIANIATGALTRTCSRLPSGELSAECRRILQRLKSIHQKNEIFAECLGNLERFWGILYISKRILELSAGNSRKKFRPCFGAQPTDYAIKYKMMSVNNNNSKAFLVLLLQL